MLVFGTEMHIVTFIFVVLELLMFVFQLSYYLLKPQDEYRKWYLILLLLLIFYNITGGLFPDPNINIPIITQNIIAYGSGFLMASYFPYYFYKGFDLRLLRFHAIYGVPLFLILPYVVFFVIAYSFNKNLDFAIQYGVIIPFFYSFIVLRAILIAIGKHYKENRNHHYYMEEIAVYCAVVPWAAMIPITYFHFSQLVEALFTNLGFLIITGMFIYKSVRRARKENALLAELDLVVADPLSINKNCKIYGLTCRETEVVILICQRFKSKEIGEKLFISERTVNKHVENIFSKVLVTTRLELIQKIGR
ncbi:regulatory protein, luxR family [Daejeonella rubra]|uniref:Regulatory protein, luxR family n=1 Tax=Daejeonella rubra TaxID=990371 RepID=A0A1G9NK43_9SPHI|nr:helix-turn-helix transcriptional regulator [Daejeonella rubra]SDL86966.1 regulatory protein, luxR family [Daejeonella rubra]